MSANYKVGIGSPPLASDVNQYAETFSGEADVGTISLASPINAPASAASGSAVAGTALGVGAYTYAYTYVTGIKKSNGELVISGETLPSPTWTVTTTADNQAVQITSLPTSGFPATVIGKRLYRSTVNGSQLKLVATIPTTQATYVDTTPDANLGENAPTSNTTGTRLSLGADPTTDSEAVTKRYADNTFVMKGVENAWTARQVFAGGIQDGDGNQDVSLIYSVQHQVHTRTTVLTYTGGRLSLVEEKDGATVVKSITLNYDGSGRLISVVETAGGVTRTATLNYDASGNLISITRT